MAEKRYPVFDFDLCVSCHVCEQACPVSAIALCVNGVDIYHNLYPQTDREKCISCGLCEKTCPIAAISMEI